MSNGYGRNIEDIFDIEGDTYLNLTKDEIEIMYYPERNVFIAEGGDMILNIHEMLTPNDLLLFRRLSKPDEIFVIAGSNKRPTILIHTYIEGQCYCHFCSTYDECMGVYDE